ncbi:peripherin-2 [Elysia marginata]|uniref:Peripherin-2 n=1 Tax=Elysia marginata TaxID=1093978 RepID=A0AAV4JW51_9GAST|nr:peripherin-2 [Elysia marginata]
MCITITVGERGRKLMGFSTTLINIVLIFLSIALFVAGIAIRIRIDKRLEIMGDYNPGALPYYLMVTAGLLFLGHMIAAWFCHSAIYVESRSDQHFYFVGVILALITLFIFVVISIIVMAVHSSLIYGALEDGIHNAMKAYKTDLDSKMRVDRLQLQFECCGVKTHKDWFKVSWVNTMYVNVLHPEVKPYLVDGEFIKDDVPFSCCSRHAKRACVHHSVSRFSQHEGISGATLHESGCADTIHDQFHKFLLAPTMWLLCIILILQAVDIPVMRLLQTSIFTADEMNDPQGVTEAYCIKGLGGGEDLRGLYKRRKSKDRDAEKGGDDDDSDEDKPKKKKGLLSKLKKKNDDDDDDDDDEDDDDDNPKQKKGFFSKFRKKGGDDDDDDDEGKGAKGLFSKFKKGKKGKDDDDDDKKKNKKGKKKDKKDKKAKKKEDKKAKNQKKKEAKKKKNAKKKAEKQKKQAKKKADKAKKKAANKAKKAAKKAKKKAKKSKGKKKK